MSKGDVIFMKGMQNSADDAWDDRRLNAAYDKALKIAQVEVAKRVAMKTNSPEQNKEAEAGCAKDSKGKSKLTKSHWKTGMFCRAIYSVDGLEYEAVITKTLNDKDCIVKFLGYNNSEIVEIENLIPSYGKAEQTLQIEQALCDNGDDGFVSPGDKMEFKSDGTQSTEDPEPVCQKKKKSSKKKSKNGAVNGQDGFDMSFMPPASMLRNLGNTSADMPLPPPPPFSMSVNDRTEIEEQAMSSMLLSWYMSGYYTGLYQGMKRAQRKQQRGFD